MKIEYALTKNIIAMNKMRITSIIAAGLMLMAGSRTACAEGLKDA